VAPVIVHQRADFASSMIDGRTVMEIARKSPSADEIALLWEYLNARLNTHLHFTDLAPLETVASG
jgi:chromosome partitioning protein